MPRLPAPSIPGRRALPLAVGVLLLLALLPSRYTRWLHTSQDLVQPLVAPVAAPFRKLSAWITRDRGPAIASQAEVLARQDAQRWETRALQAEAEITRLNDVLARLSILVSSDPGLRASHVVAPVYGTAGDTGLDLRVRAGEREGVFPGIVAVTWDLQIIGLVNSVQPRTCTIHPITTPKGPEIRGVIDVTQTSERLACVLRPWNGRLRADKVEHSSNPASELKPGQLVRLDDDRWPRSANMLILGEIESVEPSPEAPLRQAVVVRPLSARLERVAEVILRIPAQGQSPEGSP